MSQHTQGKLKVADDGSLGTIIAENGDGIGHTFQVSADDQLAGSPIRKANASRLVACWNKLTDFTTERIEADEIDWMMLRNQRDELLQALKLLMASEPLISAATDAELESGLDDEDETTRVQANAWLVARAAIKEMLG